MMQPMPGGMPSDAELLAQQLDALSLQQ